MRGFAQVGKCFGALVLACRAGQTLLCRTPSSHSWTATEAAYQLSEAFAASRGEEGADPNYTTLQTLALAMTADADYLEEVWEAVRRDGIRRLDREANHRRSVLA